MPRMDASLSEECLYLGSHIAEGVHTEAQHVHRLSRVVAGTIAVRQGQEALGRLRALQEHQAILLAGIAHHAGQQWIFLAWNPYGKAVEVREAFPEFPLVELHCGLHDIADEIVAFHRQFSDLLRQETIVFTFDGAVNDPRFDMTRVSSGPSGSSTVTCFLEREARAPQFDTRTGCRVNSLRARSFASGQRSGCKSIWPSVVLPIGNIRILAISEDASCYRPGIFMLDLPLGSR